MEVFFFSSVFELRPFLMPTYTITYYALHATTNTVQNIGIIAKPLTRIAFLLLAPSQSIDGCHRCIVKNQNKMRIKMENRKSSLLNLCNSSVK